LYDKKSEKTYSDSGILVNSDGRWYTSGWLAEIQEEMDEDSVAVSGNMWKVPDKTMTPVQNILLRLFQLTFGRSSLISLWMKERLRDILITKTEPSNIRYNRKILFKKDLIDLLTVRDSVSDKKRSISTVSVFAKDTHIYVPSSRYYVGMKENPFLSNFPDPVSSIEIEWKISSDSGVVFTLINDGSL